MSNQQLREKIKDYAIENYKEGFNCAESVFGALQRAEVIDVPAEALAMCTGFGGGVGLTGHICGALSAAVMANGAAYGRKDPMSTEADQRKAEVGGKYYRRYNRLVNDFIKENGSANCKDICKGFEDFNSKERKVSCMKLVGKTAELAYDCLCVAQEEAFKLPYGENMGKLE